MLMRPMAIDADGNEKNWRSSHFWTEKDFLEEYSKWITASQHVIECAKIYVSKNWKRISDWSGLEVVIKCRQGKFEFYNYVPNPSMEKKEEEQTEETTFEPGKKRARKVNSPTVLNIVKRLEEHNKNRHNPITSLTDVVLDPTDGDFSLTINGKELWVINGEAVIEIAAYMEEKLANEQEEEKKDSEENSGEIDPSGTLSRIPSKR